MADSMPIMMASGQRAAQAKVAFERIASIALVWNMAVVIGGHRRIPSRPFFRFNHSTQAFLSCLFPVGAPKRVLAEIAICMAFSGCLGFSLTSFSANSKSEEESEEQKANRSLRSLGRDGDGTRRGHVSTIKGIWTSQRN